MSLLLKKINRWWCNQPIIIRGLWLVLAVGWLVLFYLAVRPFGTAIYSATDQSGNYFIHKLAPLERWATSSDDLIMVGQPSYFFLRPTRPFRQAEITVAWQPRSEDTYLEAGVLMDKANWQYQTQPLNNPALNRLAWPSVASGTYRLWQKQPTFKTWDQFVAGPLLSLKLGVYNWSPSSSVALKMSGYKPSSAWQDVPGQWRGTQEIVTYLSDKEPLAWRLAVTSDAFKTLTDSERQIDINVTDSLNHQLWSGQRRLSSDRLDWEIIAGSWPAGAYRLEIKASHKLLLQLATKQSVFGWQGQIWPVAATGYQWKIWTDAPQIVAQTIQPLSRQIIKVGQQTLAINETYQQYRIDVEQSSAVIELFGGDIQLTGNGVFSLTPNIFNSQPRRIDGLSVQQLDRFDFIAANYQPPVCDEQLCQTTAVLSLVGADWQAGDGYKIMLASNNSQLSSTSPFVVKEIRVKLVGQTVSQFLASLPLRLWKKIKN